MIIYILLLLNICIFPIFVEYFLPLTKKKKSDLILNICVFEIFLVLALKASTVGIDIEGYKYQYELSKYVAWSNFNYVYFEPGYIFIMKLFSKSGFSFQLFTIIIYSFSTMSIYKFIKKYSTNNVLSIIIFVCYQYFVFYISGLRQTIAMSICINSFLLLDNNRKKDLYISFILIFVASLFHKSALIFLLVYFLYFYKKIIKFPSLIIGLVCSFTFRNFILGIINKIFNYNLPLGQVTLRGNFIFLLGIIIFYYITLYCIKKSRIKQIDIFFTNMLVLSVLLNVILSGSSLLRSVMYISMFLIVSLPRLIKYHEPRLRIFLYFIFICFFITLFVHDSLLPNQLNIYPYYFFWQ